MEENSMNFNEMHSMSFHYTRFIQCVKVIILHMTQYLLMYYKQFNQTKIEAEK